MPSTSSVSPTFSGVALNFREPIDCCGEPESSASVSLGFSLYQNIDEAFEQFDVLFYLQQKKIVILAPIIPSAVIKIRSQIGRSNYNFCQSVVFVLLRNHNLPSCS